MSRDQSVITRWAQYLGARAAVTALTMFDVETNLRSAAALGRLLYRVDERHRERALDHLRASFPEFSDEQLDDVARRSFEHFCQLVVEVCYTTRLIHRESWSARLQPKNLGPSLTLVNAGKPMLLLTGHVGNWEVLGYMLAVLGYPIEAIARPIDNPLINDWLLGIREKRGMRIITKWNATDRMLAVLASGGSLGFIADQNAGDKGLFVPFFGRLASTYKSIGLLAIDQRVPVVCGYARRLGDDFRFEVAVVDLIDPGDWETQRDPLYYITARYMRAIETMVRQEPSQYLWMHRRWKSRPRYERQGRPMPPALRRNLEELPWMTPEQMHSLTRTAVPADSSD